MKITILESGNLLLEADAETRADLAHDLREHGFWPALYSAFEPFFTNGGYHPFDAGDANPFVGLTSAPCIAESMTTEDDGSNAIEGRLWWFPDYMVACPLEDLINRGRTEFTLAE